MPDNNSSNPGSQLDTGTGGFPTPDGKRHTYDVGPPGAAAPQEIPWSGGEVNVDDSKRDISTGTKATLASYMSQTTLGYTPSAGASAPNKYPVDHAGGPPIETRLQDSLGYPIGPQKSGNEASYYSDYIPGDERSAKFDKANSTYSATARSLGVSGAPEVKPKNLLRDFTRISRASSADAGGFTPPFPNAGVAQVDPTSPISTYYAPGGPGQVSKSVIYNRFNSDTRFENYTNSNELGARQFAIKYPAGQSLPPESPIRNVSYGRLAQVGNALSLRSAAELRSTTGGANASNGTAEATAVLPGTAQLGVKRIERELLEARSVLDNLTEDNISENLLSRPAALSWGVLNDVHDQFSGISDFGMQLLGLTLFLGLSLVLLSFFTLFSWFSSTPTTSAPPVDILGRRPFGASVGSTGGADYSNAFSLLKAIVGGKFDLWQFLGLINTQHDVKKCVAVGGLAFFGSYDEAVSLLTLPLKEFSTDLSYSISQSAGYYNVMARNISRSFLQISDAFSGLGKAFGNGFFAFLNQLLSIASSIRNSKFMRAINIFARLGDTVISEKSKPDEYAFDPDGITGNVRHRTSLDFIPNASPLRGRLKVDGSNAAISALSPAWSSYRAPDMFLVPASFVPMQFASQGTGVRSPMYLSGISSETNPINHGGRKSLDGRGEDTQRILSTDKFRIDTVDRERMEELLDAEYVPFYFHDVRTNEIVSFHAFLTSLTDDYTVAYDSHDAIGRAEPIKSYKNTARKIGFSFYVAALSESDFDYMWSKINKLTTLVYPQYTAGRRLYLDPQNTIQVPFSQTIQAAPLTRIRIGDLIRSNYSKFNLARLFGMGASGTKIGGEETKTTESNDKTSLDKVVDLYKSGNFFIPSKNAELFYNLPDGFALEIIGEDTTSGRLNCKATSIAEQDLTQLYKPASLEQIRVLINNFKDVMKNKKFLIPKSMVTVFNLLPSTRQNAIKNNQDYNKIAEFMNDTDPTKGNAIVRSFRTSGGKGLAGFVESMAFDWYDRVKWDTRIDADRRAPQMCKVTISFSPIHDISPGIDNMGMNRAPIYPVGPHGSGFVSSLPTK